MEILLVTRHYPPAVSGGARRPYLLAQALRKAGAGVQVIAPSLPDGEPGVAVPHPHRDPPTTSGPARKGARDLARELLLWPDPDIRWSKRVAVMAKGLAPRADWVLTTSPPESVHHVGHALKRSNPSLRWAADFRDHWLQAPHRTERQALHRRIGEGAIAKRWLGSADLVLSVDRHIGTELRGLGAPCPVVLPHFAPPKPEEPRRFSEDGIHVVHAGSLALSDPLVDIDDALAPFAEAVRHNPQLRLHFVGRLTDAERCAIAASDVSARISVHGVVPYDEALRFIAGADGLLYVASAKANVPPSKIAEYRATNKPIIACGHGPWRADSRVDGTSPADALARLARGQTRSSCEEVLPSADDTARRLLEAMAGKPGASQT